MKDIKKAAVIGAAGMIGKPVTQELHQAGFDVTAIDMNEEALRGFPTEIETIQANLADKKSIVKALEGQDALYLSIQTPMHSSEQDFQPEREGIQTALEAAKEVGISRVLYLSSMLMDYQGQDGFDWWVYRMKHEGFKLVKNSGLPYYIFKPSTFYENVPFRFRQGNNIMVAGDSGPMWWNGASYLGQVVAAALSRKGTDSKIYYVQGPEPLTALEGTKKFLQHYKKESLELVTMPFEAFEQIKDQSPVMNYIYHITKAMNNYKEEFKAQQTWDEFGKPTATIADYAQRF